MLGVSGPLTRSACPSAVAPAVLPLGHHRPLADLLLSLVVADPGAGSAEGLGQAGQAVCDLGGGVGGERQAHCRRVRVAGEEGSAWDVGHVVGDRSLEQGGRVVAGGKVGPELPGRGRLAASPRWGSRRCRGAAGHVVEQQRSEGRCCVGRRPRRPRRFLVAPGLARETASPAPGRGSGPRPAGARRLPGPDARTRKRSCADLISRWSGATP
jgi:hypothetical protein